MQLPCSKGSALTQLLLWKSCSHLDMTKDLLEMLLLLCTPSQRLATPLPLLVDFSFPLPEKKTGKEKKKSKKVSLEGEPVADGSAEVHKKKKKKVCARP